MASAMFLFVPVIFVLIGALSGVVFCFMIMKAL